LSVLLNRSPEGLRFFCGNRPGFGVPGSGHVLVLADWDMSNRGREVQVLACRAQPVAFDADGGNDGPGWCRGSQSWPLCARGWSRVLRLDGAVAAFLGTDADDIVE
jgi:hypothetical protein